ncbi:MAG TPA: entericidin [Gallionella sp.]
MKAVALFLVSLMLAGCNTLDGLGKDLKKGGEEIQKAVKK